MTRPYLVACGDVCRVLRDRRLELGLTQERAGFLSGYDGAQISLWERAVVVPDLGTLIRVLRAYGLCIRIEGIES